jgi:hypothetical protein
MSTRAKVAIGVGVLVLVVVIAWSASSASAQTSAAAIPPAPTGGTVARTSGPENTIVGTYADGSPVFGTGTSADKSSRAVAERSRIAASKEGGI